MSAATVSLLPILANHGLGRAAVETAAGSTTAMELPVFEHPDCTYCQIFRVRVAPRYRSSPQAAEAPLRFLDIERSDTGGPALVSPITMVPTAVLVKGGREVDRISSYWGPDNFLRMVTFITGRAE